jgi:hypothetical protein
MSALDGALKLPWYCDTCGGMHLVREHRDWEALASAARDLCGYCYWRPTGSGRVLCAECKALLTGRLP